MILAGRPLRIRFAPRLSARRGRLLTEKEAGTPVHAGAFLRRRELVLDAELLEKPPELARILVHELFHFVWLRLGTPVRRSWEAVLEAESRGRARGELGWSAEWRKRELTAADRKRRSRRWREYVAESFCDTAAWLAAAGRGHDEHTLERRWRSPRRRWFRALLERGRLSI
jgi:hypothetical protein